MSGSKGESSLLVLSSAPHIKSADGINKIMWTVIIALMPSTVYSVYIFGSNAAVLLSVSVLSAFFSEFIYQKLMKTGTIVLLKNLPIIF